MRSAVLVRRPGLAVVAAVVGFLLVAGQALAAVERNGSQGAAADAAALTSQGRPYTVQAIVAGAQAVAAGGGTEPCSILASQWAYRYWASHAQPVLLAPQSLGAEVSHQPVVLSLAWTGADPLLTLLRRTPLLGRFAPPPPIGWSCGPCPLRRAVPQPATRRAYWTLCPVPWAQGRRIQTSARLAVDPEGSAAATWTELRPAAAVGCIWDAQASSTHAMGASITSPWLAVLAE